MHFCAKNDLWHLALTNLGTLPTNPYFRYQDVSGEMYLNGPVLQDDTDISGKCSLSIQILTQIMHYVYIYLQVI